MIDFHKPQPSEKEAYETILFSCPPRGCEYSFANLSLWGRQNIAFLHGCVAIFSHFYGRSVYPYPIGNGDKKAVITEVYGIGNIPEDFELTKESINNSAVFKDYENPDGAIISFSQMITEHGTTVDVDNEHSKSQTVVVNGLEVYVVESLRDDITAAFWAADGYSFNLTYIGEIDVTLLSEMISSIQVVESRKE